MQMRHALCASCAEGNLVLVVKVYLLSDMGIVKSKRNADVMLCFVESSRVTSRNYRDKEKVSRLARDQSTHKTQAWNH